MSRKDTIIVAVLINTGLLIVLFASALKSGGSEDQLVMAQEPVIEQLPALAMKPTAPVVVGDEVDRALQQFAAQQASATSSQELAAAPVAVNPFVEELRSIGTSAAPVAAPEAPAVHTLLAPVSKDQRAASNLVEFRVKKGDVLEKIARQHRCSVSEIMRENHLTNTNLRIGQVLKIPQGSDTKTAAAPAPVRESASRLYTVKKGDSLWTIAVKNQMKVEDLLKLNEMTEVQAKRLQPGDQLRIQ